MVFPWNEQQSLIILLDYINNIKLASEFEVREKGRFIFLLLFASPLAKSSKNNESPPETPTMAKIKSLPSERRGLTANCANFVWGS
jgi:hypothetical protein